MVDGALEVAAAAGALVAAVAAGALEVAAMAGIVMAGNHPPKNFNVNHTQSENKKIEN